MAYVKLVVNFFVMAALLLCAGHARAESPPSQLELNGFLLGQHVEVLSGTFDAPFKEGKSGSLLYQAYVLNREDPSYMVFQFDKERPDSIVSIQITGNGRTIMYPFLGLRLGDAKKAVLRKLGLPSETRRVEEVDADLYVFKGRNYTVEMDSKGRLSSVKIIGHEGFPAKPEKALAPLDPLRKALVSEDVNALLQVFSPDLEIYRDKEVVRYSKSARSELSDRKGRIIELLFGAKGCVREIFTVEKLAGEPSLRVYEKKPPGTVYKFPKSRIIDEIVFEVHAGIWKVWEIKFRDEERGIKGDRGGLEDALNFACSALSGKGGFS
jgi:hypothetical protein